MATGTYYVNIGGQRLGRYPRRAQLAVIIRDPASGQVLRRLALATAMPGQGRVYAQPWLDAGIRQVAVDVTRYPLHGPAFADHLLLPLTTPEP